MNKILLIILMSPVLSFAQDTNYTLNSAGMFFMIFSWTSIIIWNAVCFTKILSKKND